MKFIFVFILLATFSIVDAIPHQLHKRVTTFLPCSNGDSPLVVTLFPDPPVAGRNINFTVNGRLSQPATIGSSIAIGFFDVNDQLLSKVFRVDYCSINGIVCPAPNVSARGPVPAPIILPARYSIMVAILAPDGKKFLGCAGAYIGGSGPSSPALKSNLLNNIVTSTPDTLPTGSIWFN